MHHFDTNGEDKGAGDEVQELTCPVRTVLLGRFS